MKALAFPQQHGALPHSTDSRREALSPRGEPKVQGALLQVSPGASLQCWYRWLAAGLVAGLEGCVNIHCTSVRVEGTSGRTPVTAPVVAEDWMYCVFVLLCRSHACFCKA